MTFPTFAPNPVDPSFGTRMALKKSGTNTQFALSIRKVKQRQVENDFSNLRKTYEPLIQKSFAGAIQSIKKQIDMPALIEAVQGHNFHKVMELAIGDNLKKQLNKDFKSRIFEAYHAGASLGAAQLKNAHIKKAYTGSLNLPNQSAVDYLEEALPNLILQLNDEQRKLVQAALLRGINNGENAEEIARDIRNTVGLTEEMYTWADNFRIQLETGVTGDFTPVNQRRLNAVDARMAQDEMDSPDTNQEVVDLLVENYIDSLINKRAIDISITEIHNASIMGQDNLWGQAVELGYLDPARTRRHWLATDDDKTRADHAATQDMNDPDGVGLDEDFDTPIGPVSNPGQSGDDGFDINCRCTVFLSFQDAPEEGDVNALSE